MWREILIVLPCKEGDESIKHSSSHSHKWNCHKGDHDHEDKPELITYSVSQEERREVRNKEIEKRGSFSNDQRENQEGGRPRRIITNDRRGNIPVSGIEEGEGSLHEAIVIFVGIFALIKEEDGLTCRCAVSLLLLFLAIALGVLHKTRNGTRKGKKSWIQFKMEYSNELIKSFRFSI